MFIPAILSLAFSAAVSAEMFTSIASSSASCAAPSVVAMVMKNASLPATCAQILGGAGVTPNTCSQIPGTSSYGALGCTDAAPNTAATALFASGVTFLGFITYSPIDSACSTPLLASYVIPDGTCQTPFWPTALDVSPIKSYKVTYNPTTQVINLKYYLAVGCAGNATNSDIPGAAVNLCTNANGAYAKVVQGVGAGPLATTTAPAATPTTPVKNDAIAKSPVFWSFSVIVSLVLLILA